jgi:cystathionine beta-lyase/cystathionine gamma-synthase
MGLTMSEKPRNFATRTIHAGEQFSVADNAIFPAIVTASSFTKRSLDDNPEYSYSRVGNPTRHAYETCVAAWKRAWARWPAPRASMPPRPCWSCCPRMPTWW